MWRLLTNCRRAGRSLGDGSLTLGLDQASAEGKKANPAALAVMEKVSGRHVVRGLTWWKTTSPAVALDKITVVVKAILAAGKKIKVLNIDASNEVMFARQVQTALRGLCKVQLIKGGQKANYRGEPVMMKVFTGNMLANAFEDHTVDMPAEKYVALSPDDRNPCAAAAAMRRAGKTPPP